MKMTVQNVMDAMQALSDKHGLPVYYKNDLQIDLNYVRDFAPNAFGWMIRTHGTHFIDYKPDFPWVDTLQNNFGYSDKLVWFWFDGEQFIDMSDNLPGLRLLLRTLPESDLSKVVLS